MRRSDFPARRRRELVSILSALDVDDLKTTCTIAADLRQIVLRNPGPASLALLLVATELELDAGLNAINCTGAKQ